MGYGAPIGISETALHLKQGGGRGASVTFVEQSSFQPLSIPLRLTGNGDCPKHRTFSEVVKIDADGILDIQVFIEAPTATSTPRESGKVHLRRRNVLDHCVETDQGPIKVNVWRIVEREWRNLSSEPEG